MKEALQKHVAHILNSIGLSDVLASVYDCEHESVPRFVVVNDKRSFLCLAGLDIEKSKRSSKRLAAFLGKDIFSVEHAGKAYLFWFEEKVFDDLYQKNTDFITHTRLPAWLDSYIYDSLNSTYNPDHVKYSCNLDRTREELLVYLGTYFPRSYAEAFCITENILQNRTILSEFFRKEEIKILSVGCGTGGDLLGLLTVLSKTLPSLKAVNIKAVDGNAESLSVLTALLNKSSEYMPFKIEFDVHHRKFEPRDGEIFFGNTSEKFDFVLSFKMISELTAKCGDSFSSAYYLFCKEILQCLSLCGICILLDVTARQNQENSHYDFIPTLLNHQINKALRELKNYKSLLPLPCNLHESHCDDANCFSQKIITVSHRKRVKDVSKVSYRVIMRNDFCDKIVNSNSLKMKKFFIGKIKRHSIEHDEPEMKICRHTQTNIELADGFNLSAGVELCPKEAFT